MPTSRQVRVAALVATVFGSSIAFAAPPYATYYTVNRGNPVLQSHGKYIDKMIADFSSRKGLPGITRAIFQAPYVPRPGGYRCANLDNDELASTMTCGISTQARI